MSKTVDAAAGVTAKVAKGDLEASASVAVESSSGQTARTSSVSETLEVEEPAE